jgi:hypothetical protein
MSWRDDAEFSAWLRGQTISHGRHVEVIAPWLHMAWLAGKGRSK